MGETSDYPILEIYHPSISLGDCAVIVTREKSESIAKMVLIDLGCNPEEVLIWCTDHIPGYSKNNKIRPFDYIILSHYHQDHYGGLNHSSLQTDYFISSYVSKKDKSRLDELEKKMSFSTKRTYSSNSSNEDPTKPISLDKLNINKKSVNLFEELIRKAAPDKDDIEEEESFLVINLTPNISEKDFSIQMICICANGIYLNENEEPKACEGEFKNWNDHSIGWLLEYKINKKVIFRYFSAGDLSGNTEGNYTNAEASLLPYLKEKKVDLLKATHHGSRHSLTYNFLNTIKATEIIIPCNNKHLLPFPDFFDRLVALNNNENYTPRIFLANYLELDKDKYEGDYNKRFKNKKDKIGYKSLVILNNKGSINPKLEIDDDAIFIERRDNNGYATLPGYLTLVTAKGANTTKSDKLWHKFEIKGVSNVVKPMPNLTKNRKLAEAIFKISHQRSMEMHPKDKDLPKAKIDDFYEEGDHYLQQKSAVNYELKQHLISGFKQCFPREKSSDLFEEFLENPLNFKGETNKNRRASTRIKRIDKSRKYLDYRQEKRYMLNTKSRSTKITYQPLIDEIIRIEKKKTE